MLAVHRHDLRAAALGGVHDQLARADQGLLVRQRNALFLLDGGKRRAQPDHADDGGHDGVRLVDGRGGEKPLHAAQDFDFGVREAAAQLACRVLIVKHRETRGKLPCLRFDQIHARVGGQRRDL